MSEVTVSTTRFIFKVTFELHGIHSCFENVDLLSIKIKNEDSSNIQCTQALRLT